jgi:hypothetical protein
MDEAIVVLLLVATAITFVAVIVIRTPQEKG